MADALLTVEHLTKSFGDKLLFEDISFGINAGQKSALIAHNGYGKSTLLNIIMTAAGQKGYNTLQDSGKFTFHGEPEQREPSYTTHAYMASKENTSEYLKDCMSAAVIKLLEQWPLDKIQVKQICDASGYHRASWFRAFRSKSEAVTYHMVRLWQLYSERHCLVGHDDWIIENAEAFFQYNYEIRDTLRLLQRRGLMKELADSFTATLHDHYIEDPIRAYHTAMFAYSLYGILREWIVRDFDQPPKMMARIVRDTIASMQ